MKILLLHTDYIQFNAKSKTKIAEDVPEEMKSQRAEEALAVFTAVEKVDEANPKKTVEMAMVEVEKVYGDVKAQTIVVYPYAHLSSSLSKPDVAVKVLKDMQDGLAGKGYNVIRAPFGWYKGFELKCKGHPLSELSREIIAVEAGGEEEEEHISSAFKAEKKLTSNWYILDTDGSLVDPKDFNFKKYPSLKTFYDYETSGTRTMEKEPPHIRLMKDHELVDYEPGSDQGNLRWYPKGTLIKKLLEEHVTNIVTRHGGMQVETPIMYDFEHPQLSKYLNRFPARQYVVKSDDKEYFLRFAACFGQYLMKHDMNISYKHLPVMLYELTHYSFRREQSGELAGLKRLRAFTMPDMHTLCRDMDQAKEAFKQQYDLSMDWMRDIGLEYDVAMRFVKGFFDENKDFAMDLVQKAKRPILLELWDERFFYFVMKFEFSFNDALKKAATLSTVQIDVENAERFEINYVDENSQKQNPLLLHASISGSIDRNLYALLENAYLKGQKGEKPMLPVWLSPTQVRIVPVSEANLEYSEGVLEFLESNNIRADVDDESNTLQKKIRNAEKEWIPYIAVIGAREEETGEIAVRVRTEKGKQINMTRDALAEKIKEDMKGKPFKLLPLPNHLSRRPKFR